MQAKRRWVRWTIVLVSTLLLLTPIVLLAWFETCSRARYRQASEAFAIIRQIRVGEDANHSVEQLKRLAAFSTYDQGCFVTNNFDPAPIERWFGRTVFFNDEIHLLPIKIAVRLHARPSWFRAAICSKESRLILAEYSVDYYSTHASVRSISVSMASLPLPPSEPRYGYVRPGVEIRAGNMTTIGGGWTRSILITPEASESDRADALNIDLSCLTSTDDCHFCRVLPAFWKAGLVRADDDANHDLNVSELDQARRYCNGIGTYPDY